MTDIDQIERELEALKAEQLRTPGWKFWRHMALGWRISRLHYERACILARDHVKKPPPPAPPPRWKIVVGDRVLGFYDSEILARRRWYALRQSVLGYGSKLVHPDGKVEE